jgi:hypothetical protein
MTMKEKDGIDAVLFADGVELLDLKCFRGDRQDVTEEEIKAQIHSALMQKKMKRARVSDRAPSPDVSRVNARELLSELAEA